MLALPSLPFHSAASGSVPEFPVTPTSSHLVVVGHEEASMAVIFALFSGSPATGTGTCQMVPLKSSGSPTSREPLTSKPAAAHRVADGHDTPERMLNEPGFLVAWIVHGGAVPAEADPAASRGSATSATRKPVSHRARAPARRRCEKACTANLQRMDGAGLLAPCPEVDPPGRQADVRQGYAAPGLDGSNGPGGARTPSATAVFAHASAVAGLAEGASRKSVSHRGPRLTILD